jgi:hypothetical protein
MACPLQHETTTLSPRLQAARTTHHRAVTTNPRRLLWPAIDVRHCVAGEITQYFPAVAAGNPLHVRSLDGGSSTEILAAGTHNYDSAAVVQSVEFMRGYKPIDRVCKIYHRI